MVVADPQADPSGLVDSASTWREHDYFRHQPDDSDRVPYHQEPLPSGLAWAQRLPGATRSWEPEDALALAVERAEVKAADRHWARQAAEELRKAAATPTSFSPPATPPPTVAEIVAIRTALGLILEREGTPGGVSVLRSATPISCRT